MNEIKIDFSKVTVKEYLEFHVGVSYGSPADSFSALMTFGEKAIVGGIMDRPMTDLPVILSQLTKYLQEESDTIAIAVASMQTYLKDKEDE